METEGKRNNLNVTKNFLGCINNYKHNRKDSSMGLICLTSRSGQGKAREEQGPGK